MISLTLKCSTFLNEIIINLYTTKIMNREYDVSTVELEGKFNYHIIQKNVFALVTGYYINN